MRKILVASLYGAFGLVGGCQAFLNVSDDPCLLVSCGDGLVCQLGECVVPQGPCNPSNFSGECTGGADVVQGVPTSLFVCVGGICFENRTEPTGCSTQAPNGVCPLGQACVSGVCSDLTTENACSAMSVNGACQGGELCFGGVCFDDALSVACSEENPNGACTEGGFCVAGSCTTQVNATCSDFDFDGTCPAWERCVQGTCEGPVPTDLCSPENTTGRCDANSVCLNGHCTRIDTSFNSCAPERPNGLCDDNATCIEGRCFDIKDGAECSGSNPTGLCPGGFTCQGGTCVTTACDQGGFACSVGEICVDGGCIPDDCTTLTPFGMCPNTTDACVQGVCGEPSCSSDNVTGVCPFGLGCEDGTCVVVPCSPSFPTGSCPGEDICENGVCVEGPCTATNLDGTCTDTAVTCHPTFGCNNIPTTCCDETLVGSEGCNLGTCTPEPCDATQVSGVCPNAQYCNDGTCEVAPCSPFFLSGACDALEQCITGTCRKTGCVSQADPAAFCTPQVCDTDNDFCADAPCSPTTPTGFCDIGQTCCDATLNGLNACSIGTCIVPPCTPSFPGGTCPSGELCAGGTCIVPPCNPNFPGGNCGTNFTCCNDTTSATGSCTLDAACPSIGDESTCEGNASCRWFDDACYDADFGSCVLADCDAQNPLGRCPNSGDKCSNGMCLPFVCSTAFNFGPCPIGQICQTDTCVVATCSAQYPGGQCPMGQVCAGGTCVDEPCSAAFPSGACGNGFVCNAGVCEPGPCSGSVPNGSCDAICDGLDQTTCGTTQGCSWNGTSCENNNLVCLTGSCVTYECGANFTSGPCPAGQECLTPPTPPVCQVPDCATAFPGGSCAFECTSLGQAACDAKPGCLWNGSACNNNSFICVSGTCTNSQCSVSAVTGSCPSSLVCCDDDLATQGFCEAPAVCQAVMAEGTCNMTTGCAWDGDSCESVGYGACVLRECSAMQPTGGCYGADAGKVCLSGTCVDPICGVNFPNGTCPANEICINNACTTVCSSSARVGWCPDGFACIEGVCAEGCQGSMPSLDLDCDGIFNTEESLTACDTGDGTDQTTCQGIDPNCAWFAASQDCYYDTDGDGSPDAQDRDADNDTIPDAVEAGDLLPSTPPVNTDGLGEADFRDLDSDEDRISDTLEAGVAPGNPTDTDQDGTPDMLDDDSDNDGIFDRCEAAITLTGSGAICTDTGILMDAAVLDSDGDGVLDFRDTDSDDDGVPDAVEARTQPHNPATLVATGGIDTDGDRDTVGEDYRDVDSDNDGVDDEEEDINGDGSVDCQLDVSGNSVLDTRTPACDAMYTYMATNYTYDYNAGCIATGNKCVLGETSRIHPDTDADGLADNVDGIQLTCAASNLKEVNIFYSRDVDYAFALEEDYTDIQPLSRAGSGGAEQIGIVFHDNDNTPTVINGSYPVSGFVLGRVPSAAAQAASDPDSDQNLIVKALAQVAEDEIAMSGVSTVSSLERVIGTNYISFDGYGVVLTRYNVTATGNTDAPTFLKEIGLSLDSEFNDFTPPARTETETSFTLVTQHLYRYDTSLTDNVITVAALTSQYDYRPDCPAFNGNQPNCDAAPGCSYNSMGGTCEERSDYQLPLFFTQNIAGGSAVSQWGDDLDALCQSYVQAYGKLDVVWVVDDSFSMETEINQVNLSANTFFGLLNQTEADYRIGQVTTYVSTAGYSSTTGPWGPGFSTATFGAREDGVLSGDFTGYIAGGAVTPGADRSFSYDCNLNPRNADPLGTGVGTTNCATYEGCAAGVSGDPCRATVANCCTECFCENITDMGTCTATTGCAWAGSCTGTRTDTINSPACYFASRLPPTDTLRGAEFGLAMGMWATYRAGGDSICLDSGNQTPGTCAAESGSGCIWTGTNCIAGYCELPSGMSSQFQCDGGAFVQNGANSQDELQPYGCSWSLVDADCRPDFDDNLCNGADMVTCTAQGGGFCVWNGSSCQAPDLEQLRADAEKVMVVLSDEEDCYIKDHDNDGDCSFFPGYGSNVSALGSEPRETRTSAFRDYFRSRDMTVFGIIGDKASASNPGGCARQDITSVTPSVLCSTYDNNNPGCLADPLCVWNPLNGCDTTMTNPLGCTGTGQCYANIAEAGNAYADVAEGTGGGWGSICAEDLLPTIENIVNVSLGKASPYKLEANIGGNQVQPIASTIQIAAEVCLNFAADYPDCRSGTGTQMQIVPRSREDGWDYDPTHNAVVFYGDSRPTQNGDVVASYRYWIDNPQPPAGNPGCPCPEATYPACNCTAGTACALSQSVTACDGIGVEATCNSDPDCRWVAGFGCTNSALTDACAAQGNENDCEDATIQPGCTWNEVLGCIANGICAPDPTCGGGCGATQTCDADFGLCVCAKDCNGNCGAGETCDNNNACEGLNQATCDVTSGCTYNASVAECFSDTCGACSCDTTCGGGCPVGLTCDMDTMSPTCGQCSCDTTCGGACTGTEVCDTDTMSPTCGTCGPPRCNGPGDCQTGFTCVEGTCQCDATCGGTCPPGSSCDDDVMSGTCGQCTCDPTCGGSCPSGQLCSTSGATCGLCQPDPTCGGGSCNVDCSGGTNQSACGGISGCRWAPFANGGAGLCQPLTFLECNPTTGLCEADDTCNNQCGPTETCNANTGECECDTNCGFACGPGQMCDNTVGSATCGLCLCDTACGMQTCPNGLTCNDNAFCSTATDSVSCLALNTVCGGLDEATCTTTLGCFYDTGAGACTQESTCDFDNLSGACISVTCGLCVVDRDCGGACGPNELCNPTTGICEPQCPVCNLGTVCDTQTAACVCDPTCGGTCPLGSQCDTLPSSQTCGQCVCDQSCGGPCPTGQVCDDASASPTCGQCVIDTTCGGNCPLGQVCDTLTGVCVADPNCGLGCPAGFTCDPVTRSCRPAGG